jgi:hypothetical protein
MITLGKASSVAKKDRMTVPERALYDVSRWRISAARGTDPRGIISPIAFGHRKEES